jgi:hypothetical protein
MGVAAAPSNSRRQSVPFSSSAEVPPALSPANRSATPLMVQGIANVQSSNDLAAAADPPVRHTSPLKGATKQAMKKAATLSYQLPDAETEIQRLTQLQESLGRDLSKVAAEERPESVVLADWLQRNGDLALADLNLGESERTIADLALDEVTGLGRYVMRGDLKAWMDRVTEMERDTAATAGEWNRDDEKEVDAEMLDQVKLNVMRDMKRRKKRQTGLLAQMSKHLGYISDGRDFTVDTSFVTDDLDQLARVAEYVEEWHDYILRHGHLHRQVQEEYAQRLADAEGKKRTIARGFQSAAHTTGVRLTEAQLAQVLTAFYEQKQPPQLAAGGKAKERLQRQVVQGLQKEEGVALAQEGKRLRLQREIDALKLQVHGLSAALAVYEDDPQRRQDLVENMEKTNHVVHTVAEVLSRQRVAALEQAMAQMRERFVVMQRSYDASTALVAELSARNATMATQLGALTAAWDTFQRVKLEQEAERARIHGGQASDMQRMTATLTDLIGSTVATFSRVSAAVQLRATASVTMSHAIAGLSGASHAAVQAAAAAPKPAEASAMTPTQMAMANMFSPTNRRGTVTSLGNSPSAVLQPLALGDPSPSALRVSFSFNEDAAHDASASLPPPLTITEPEEDALLPQQACQLATPRAGAVPPAVAAAAANWTRQTAQTYATLELKHLEVVQIDVALNACVQEWALKALGVPQLGEGAHLAVAELNNVCAATARRLAAEERDVQQLYAAVGGAQAGGPLPATHTDISSSPARRGSTKRSPRSFSINAAAGQSPLQGDVSASTHEHMMSSATPHVVWPPTPQPVKVLLQLPPAAAGAVSLMAPLTPASISVTPVANSSNESQQRQHLQFPAAGTTPGATPGAGAAPPLLSVAPHAVQLGLDGGEHAYVDAVVRKLDAVITELNAKQREVRFMRRLIRYLATCFSAMANGDYSDAVHGKMPAAKHDAKKKKQQGGASGSAASSAQHEDDDDSDDGSESGDGDDDETLSIARTRRGRVQKRGKRWPPRAAVAPDESYDLVWAEEVKILEDVFGQLRRVLCESEHREGAGNALISVLECVDIDRHQPLNATAAAAGRGQTKMLWPPKGDDFGTGSRRSSAQPDMTPKSADVRAEVVRRGSQVAESTSTAVSHVVRDTRLLLLDDEAAAKRARCHPGGASQLAVIRNSALDARIAAVTRRGHAERSSLGGVPSHPGSRASSVSGASVSGGSTIVELHKASSRRAMEALRSEAVSTPQRMAMLPTMATTPEPRSQTGDLLKKKKKAPGGSAARAAEDEAEEKQKMSLFEKQLRRDEQQRRAFNKL